MFSQDRGDRDILFSILFDQQQKLSGGGIFWENRRVGFSIDFQQGEDWEEIMRKDWTEGQPFGEGFLR